MDLCNPKHPQSNGMVEKMLGNLAKITHAAIMEGKKPSELLQSFLREYRATPNISTGIATFVLLFGHALKTRLLPVPPCSPSTINTHLEVRKKDEKQKL